MKRLISITTTILIVMVLAVPVFAEDPDPGAGSTNFTVMNLSDSATANVQADYISAMTGLEGAVSASWPTTITARSSAGFAAATAGSTYSLPDNWKGSVIVSSDQPVVAFAQMIWTNSALVTTEGRYKTAGAYNGFTAGANKLFLPSLSQRPGAQDSVIAVQSADAASTSETVAFSIKFYDRAGAPTHTINDTVNKGAQKSYNLTAITTDLFAATGGNGAAVIEATDPADLLAASATMHWANYSAAYSAVTGGGTKIALPSATRRIPDGTNWYQYTGVVVQNLDPTLSADARVTWYDRDGNSLHVFTDTIPANSAHGYNTRFPDTSDVPASSKATLPVDLTDDWNGSVVIESVGTGTADIVAVANLQWFMYHPSSPNSASAYTSFAGGTETVFVPATFRRNTGGGDPWKQFTGLIVQNVGATACNNFGVSWRDRDGNELLAYTDSLDPNISHGYNTKQGSAGSDIPATADVADLLDDFRGSVTISGGAGCELVAIHNTVWPIWTDSTTYNAFGQ